MQLWFSENDTSSLHQHLHCCNISHTHKKKLNLVNLASSKDFRGINSHKKTNAYSLENIDNKVLVDREPANMVIAVFSNSVHRKQHDTVLTSHSRVCSVANNSSV